MVQGLSRTGASVTYRRPIAATDAAVIHNVLQEILTALIIATRTTINAMPNWRVLAGRTVVFLTKSQKSGGPTFQRRLAPLPRMVATSQELAAPTITPCFVLWLPPPSHIGREAADGAVQCGGRWRYRSLLPGGIAAGESLA